MNEEEKEWGGTREGAGRVSVIERKYRHFYLSLEEEKIDRQIVDAFKATEAELKRTLAKQLKCRQYEVEERVYKKLLALRETLAATSLEMIAAEKDAILQALLNEKQSS